MDEMVLKTQKWLKENYNGKAGFSDLSDKDIDGITGAGTFKRLVQALQIELNEHYGANITVDGSFGVGTLKALPKILSSDNKSKQIVYILQGSMWCKGYSAGPLDGIYGTSVVKGIKNSKMMQVLQAME